MLGAIAGDGTASVYEHHQIKAKEFPLFHPGCGFTDDSVLTVAVAKAILEGGTYRDAVLELGTLAEWAESVAGKVAIAERNKLMVLLEQERRDAAVAAKGKAKSS